MPRAKQQKTEGESQTSATATDQQTQTQPTGGPPAGQGPTQPTGATIAPPMDTATILKQFEESQAQIKLAAKNRIKELEKKDKALEQERQQNEAERDRLMAILEGADGVAHTRKPKMQRGMKQPKGERQARSQGGINKTRAVEAILAENAGKKGIKAEGIWEVARKKHPGQMKPADIISALQALRRRGAAKTKGEARDYTYFYVAEGKRKAAK